MKKLVAAIMISTPLTACYTNEPALTGAVVGGATGAAIGAATTDRVGGALIGGALGATTGALIGAAATPRMRCEWDPYYGTEVCYGW